MRFCIFLLAVAVGFAGVADEAVDQFNFATGLLIRDEPELAADEFGKLLKAHPQFAQADVAWFRLGEALRQSKKEEKAIEAYARVVKDYPQSERAPQANYQLAGLILTNDPARAAAAYAAAAVSPALAEGALLGQAEALYRAGKWKEAGAAYGALLQRFPESKYAPQALNGQGWAAFKGDDYAAAARYFTSFLERFGNDALANECRLKRADALYRLKRYNEAAADYEALTASGEPAQRPAALAGRAWCLYDSGKVQESAALFRAAATAFAGGAQAAALRFNAGNAAFASADFAAAADDFAAAATGNDGAARSARYWQAAALKRAGRAAEAEKVLAGLLGDKDIEAALAADALMLRAEAALALDRAADAAAYYATVARDHAGSPRAGDAAAAAVLALEKAGDLASAAKGAAAFGATYPKHSQAGAMAFLVGEYRYRQGRFAEAFAAFAAFLKNFAGHELTPDALYKAGWACWQVNDAAGAAPCFERLAAEFPKTEQAAESSFMAGRCLDFLGDNAAARRALERAVNLAPQGDAGMRAALELARLDQRAGQYEAALKRVEAFIGAFDGKPAAAQQLPFAWLYKGEALLDLDRAQEALDAYGQALKGEAAVARAAAMGQAWALRKLKKYYEAAAAFAALADGDDNGEALFWSARSYDDVNDVSRAAAAYTKFLQNHAQGGLADEAAYRRVAVQARQDGYAKHIEAFAELVKTRPQSAFAAAALYDLAWAMQEQKKLPEAAQRFAELAQRFPDHRLAGDAHFRLGEIAYDAGDMAAAAAAYNTALDKVEFKEKVLYKLGWALERQSKSDEALKVFRRLANEYGDSDLGIEARYRGGRLLQEAGRYDEAAAAYAAVPAGAFAERAAFGRAEALRLGKQGQEAVAAYRQLLQGAADKEIKMRAWLGLGHAFREAGANQDALEAYGEVVKLTETVEAAQALLGEGYVLLAMKQYEEAAKAFLKVDILYGYDELKPEAVDMLVKVWQEAGDAEKVAKYRKRLEEMRKQ